MLEVLTDEEFDALPDMSQREYTYSRGLEGYVRNKKLTHVFNRSLDIILTCPICGRYYRTTRDNSKNKCKVCEGSKH